MENTTPLPPYDIGSQFAAQLINHDVRAQTLAGKKSAVLARLRQEYPNVDAVIEEVRDTVRNRVVSPEASSAFARLVNGSNDKASVGAAITYLTSFRE